MLPILLNSKKEKNVFECIFVFRNPAATLPSQAALGIAWSDLLDGLGRMSILLLTEANGKDLLNWTSAQLGQDKSLLGFSKH